MGVISSNSICYVISGIRKFDICSFIYPSVTISSNINVRNHHWNNAPYHLVYDYHLVLLQEITLWRKGDIVRKSMSHQAAIASQRFEGSYNPEKSQTQSNDEDDS